VALNEAVFKEMSRLMSGHKTTSSKTQINSSQAAKAMKSYYRRGPMDYKIDPNGKPIYESNSDYYSANRFMRKDAHYQYGGS
jgi:hypothetical protein